MKAADLGIKTVKPGARPQVNCVRYCVMQKKQKTEDFLNVIKLFIQKFSITDSVAIATDPGDRAAAWSASCLSAAASRCVRCWQRGRGRSFPQREEVGEGLPAWQETST